MKNLYHFRPKSYLLSLILFISFLFTANTYASNWPGRDIEIFVSCVEDLGNGRLLAHFGYENPGETSVSVHYTRSIIWYNNGRSWKYVLNTFEPGVHDRVFSQEFGADEWVKWFVKFSLFDVEYARATSASQICEGGLDIIPGYEPPLGGKEYNSKIGAELTSLYNAYMFDPDNFEGATDFIFQLEGTKVLIEVLAEDGQYDAMISSLLALPSGFELVTNEPNLNHATGWSYIGDLLLHNAIEDLFHARPVYPGVSNYIVPPTGLTKSQGDFAMHSDFARLGYEIDGSGVKIGVLSNSYNSQLKAQTDIVNGDLPGADNPNGFLSEVQVLQDKIPTFGTLSDEGRAMLQIVHDVAPGAQLAFRTGYLGELDMADGIRELADAGCDVIVDDLSYITEPYFRDGVISQAIDEVVSDGVAFFSSAGNFGRTSFSAVYNPTTAPSSITGTAHNFDGAGDIFQEIELPEGDYLMVAQWDDGTDASMNTTATDLDIFLSNDDGSTTMGFNRENIGAFPIEVVPFSIVGETVISNIVISRAAGPEVPVTFKYIIFRGGSLFNMLEYGDQGNSTIVGHPNSAGAISVGAVRFDKNQVYSPDTYTMPVIMSFSSVGGTPVNGIVRNKPDITAPNGVNTTVDLGNGDWDDPIDPDILFPNFFGTSASSPHAAAVAALIMEAKAKFDIESAVTPEIIRDMLKSTALDMETPGDDLISGSGFIQAHKAIMTFANPTPYVENLILASEGVPGEEITPFSFTVTGDFFTEDTEVHLRGEPLDNGVLFVDEHTIEVDHPGFLGNPEVQAYNPVISPSTLDGGYSEGIYFSDPVKQTVVITANDATKKYGEGLPVFTASIIVNTVEDESLTLEQAVSGGIMLQEEADRLSGHSFAVTADAGSDAGNYIIVPSISPDLDMDNPVGELDNSISEKYILEFVNGALSIEKLALTITPNDFTMVYGQEFPDVGGIDFSYEIDDTEVDIPNLDLILANVEDEHSSALTNEIALIRGIAMVNGIPMIRGIAMVNGVTMTRGIALVNGIEVRVEEEDDITTVYVAGEPVASGTPLVRGIALVNDLPFVSMTEIVRGIALVNGAEVTFEDGYMTELDGVALDNAVPAVRGIAMVNGPGPSIRGIALVNGVEVAVLDGVTTIGGESVPTTGIVEINGIPVVRGIALVNSGLITRGIALVNGTEVPVENGSPKVRGIAMVNGIPMIRGIALVNELEVHVDNGEVIEILEDGDPLPVLAMENGVGFIRGIALVNGTDLSDGDAMVNGIALVNEAGSGEDVVNLENMNLMASGTALTNGNIPGVRGIAMVNGVESMDGNALKIAAETIQEDGSVLNVSTARGIALVNGLAYVRGIALVNNEVLTSDHPVVNGSTVDDNSNTGSIMVFDATDLEAEVPPESLTFNPMSFVTGTTAGKHWIIPGTYLSDNFEISYGLGCLTISPAELTISADNKSKFFGEPDPDLTKQVNGLFADDQVTGELNREEGEDVGDYAIQQGSISAGDNYAITFEEGTLSIKQAGLSIIADDKLKTYGEDDPALTYTYSGLLGEDVISGALIREDGEDVGDYLIQKGDLSAGDNYNITFEEGTLTIEQAGLTITAEDKLKTYGEDDPALTFTYSGLLGEDVISGALIREDGENVGDYLIQKGDVSAGDNYDIAFVEGTLTIEQAGLTITAVDKFKTYGAVDPALTYTYSGLLGEDVISGALTREDGENVGDYLIQKGDVSAGDNYDITFEEGTLSIDPKDLFITAVDKEKIYGEADPALTFTRSGLVGDDPITGALIREDGENVGAYAILQGDVSAGANYTIVYTEGNLTIKQATLTITADDLFKTYGEADPALTFTQSGLVGDDPISGALIREDGENVGAYAILQGDVSAGGNYDISFTEGTLTVEQAGLTITADDKYLTYGEADPVLTFTQSGLVGEDQITGTLMRAGGKDVGAYAILQGDLSAGSNYDITYFEGVLYIEKKELEIGIIADNKIYDGTNAAVSSAFIQSGLEYGDLITVSSDNGMFSDKNVGIYKLVTASVSVSGADAGNYHANSTAEATADITQKLVHVTPVELKYWIKERDPLPDINFIYDGWIEGDSGNEGFVVLRFWSWRPYDETSCRSSGIYLIKPTPVNSNYTYVIQKALLYVRNLYHCHSDKNYTKSATVSADIREDDPGSIELQAYPNPVTEKVNLSMKGIENYKMIQIYDMSGRSHPISSIVNRSNRLEIDMSQLASGHYVIRIIMEKSVEVVQVIKR